LAESSVRDRTLADLNISLDLDKLVLMYGDHRGHPGLRHLLADEASCPAQNVLLTTGAAGALFIVSTSLLTKADHLIVLRPNYATNIETPHAIGCPISFVELELERGWCYTAEDITAHIRPNTKLISLTTPHNPTGAVLPQDELQRIVQLAQARNIAVLVDETYRDLTFGTPPPPATRLGENVISVSSLSKAYGLPGLRLGWLMTQSEALAHTFLAAKEQMQISGAVIEEEVAFAVLRNRAGWLPRIQAETQRGLGMVQAWMQQQAWLEWVPPQGGVVCFPRIKPDAPVDVERFYRALNNDYVTFVGPGHWFEQDRRYMRVGFGWPTPSELEEGLENISSALNAAVA
jgi:aspartate/methionine/tyrosine aminotransferase